MNSYISLILEAEGAKERLRRLFQSAPEPEKPGCARFSLSEGLALIVDGYVHLPMSSTPPCKRVRWGFFLSAGKRLLIRSSVTDPSRVNSETEEDSCNRYAVSRLRAWRRRGDPLFGLVFRLFWAKAKSRSSFFAGGERSFYDSNPTLRQL